MGFLKDLLHKCSSQNSLQSTKSSLPHTKNASVTTLQLELARFQLPKDPNIVAKDRHETVLTLPQPIADCEEVRHFLYLVLTHKLYGLTKICPQWVLETCWSWKGQGEKILDLGEIALEICPMSAGAAPIDKSKYAIEKVPTNGVREMIGEAVTDAIRRGFERELYQPMVDQWNEEIKRSVAQFPTTIDVPSDHQMWQRPLPRERNPYHSRNGNFTNAWVSTLEDNASGSSFPSSDSPLTGLEESSTQDMVNPQAISSTSIPPHHKTAPTVWIQCQSSSQFRSEENSNRHDSPLDEKEDRGTQKHTPSRYRRRSQQSLSRSTAASIPEQDDETSAVSYQTLARLGMRHASLYELQDPTRRAGYARSSSHYYAYDHLPMATRIAYQPLNLRNGGHQRGYHNLPLRSSAINDLPSLPSQLHRNRNNVDVRQQNSSPRPSSRMTNYSSNSRPGADCIPTLEPILLEPHHQSRPDSCAGGARWTAQPPSRIAFFSEPVIQHSATRNELRPASRASHKSGLSHRSSNPSLGPRSPNNYCIETNAAQQADRIAARRQLLHNARRSTKNLQAQGSARKARATAQVDRLPNEQSHRMEAQRVPGTTALRRHQSFSSCYDTIEQIQQLTGKVVT